MNSRGLGFENEKFSIQRYAVIISSGKYLHMTGSGHTSQKLPQNHC